MIHFCYTKRLREIGDDLNRYCRMRALCIVTDRHLRDECEIAIRRCFRALEAFALWC